MSHLGATATHARAGRSLDTAADESRLAATHRAANLAARTLADAIEADQPRDVIDLYRAEYAAAVRAEREASFAHVGRVA